MAEWYVSSTASGGGAGSEVDPWTIDEAFTAITDATVALADRVNVKVDGTYTLANSTITRTCTAGNAITIEGYSSTIGDGGQATLQRQAGETGTWITSNAFVRGIWKNIIFDSNDVGNGTNYGVYGHSSTTYLRCQFLNAQEYVYATYTGIFHNCFFYKVKQAILTYGDFCLLDGVDKSETGFISCSVMMFCIAYRAAIGYSNAGHMINCIAHDCTGGVNTTVAPAIQSNVAISDCSGYGVTVAAGATVNMYNFNVYNCGADVITGQGTHHDKTTFAPQYTDPTTYDFTRTGNNLDDVGFSTIAFPSTADYEIDIGPYQRKDPGSGATVVTGDPFSAVYDELWLLLTDSSEFSVDVKAGNRIKYTGTRKTHDPEKQEVSTEDMPEVRLVAGGMTPHPQNTSSSSRMTTRYSIEIRSGNKDLSKAHYPIIWAVYRAMVPWAARLTALTWNGKTFVVLGRPITEIVEGMERGEVTRGIEGWFCIWTIEVDMWFTTSDL